MTEVIETLDDAIESLREAKEKADLGTQMMIEEIYEEAVDVRERTARIQERQNDGT